MKAPILGPAYQSRAKSLGNNRLVNLYPRTGVSLDGSRTGALIAVPGLKSVTWTDATFDTTKTDIVASDKGASDYLGCSVSMNGAGTILVAGAYGDDDDGTNAGAAYVFTKTNGAWEQSQKLSGSDVDGSDSFGASVAINRDGTLIVVGAPAKGTTPIGAVYVFGLVGGVWTETQKLVAGDVTTTGEFGYSVHISPDGLTILVGAKNKNSIGAVYVFRKVAGTWTELQKLRHTGYSLYDYIGNSVTCDYSASVIVAGVWGYSNGGFSGAIATFTESSGTWSFSQLLTSSDPNTDDFFGASVAMNDNGTRIVIGAYGDDAIGTSGGAVYVFEGSTTSFTQTDKLAPDVTTSVSNFGRSVGIDSTGALLGVIEGYSRQYFHTFEYGSSGYSQSQKLDISAQPTDNGAYVINHRVAFSSDGSVAAVGLSDVTVTGSAAAGMVNIFEANGSTDLVLA